MPSAASAASAAGAAGAAGGARPRKRKKAPPAYPVVSPTKGGEQVRRYAQGMPPALPRAAYRPPSDLEAPITRLHHRIPSELGQDDWDTLHQQLGVLVIPESPPQKRPQARKPATAARPKVSYRELDGHVHDSEEEGFPCVHCL